MPFRLSPKSLPWANDAIQKVFPKTTLDTFHPLGRVAYALRTTNVKLYRLIDTATTIHAIEFDDSAVYIHPAGLSNEVRKLLATTVRRTLKVLA